MKSMHSPNFQDLFQRNTRFASSIRDKERKKSQDQKVVIHEIDKGLGCEKCGSSCPGLDLHIWRKVCKHCYCSWEFHTVPKAKEKPERKCSAPALAIKPFITDQKRILHKISDPGLHKPVDVLNVTRQTSSDLDLLESQQISKENSIHEIKHDKIHFIPSIEINDVNDQTENLPSIELDLLNSSSTSPDVHDTSELTPTDDDVEYCKEISNVSLSSSEVLLNDNLIDLSEIYTWYPPGANPDLLDRFMKLIPFDRRPIRYTQSAIKCCQISIEQNPEQDSNPDLCHPLSEMETNLIRKFTERRYKKFRGIGVVVEIAEEIPCSTCSKIIVKNDLAIKAPLISINSFYHVQCFHCKQCLEFLQDLIYFHKNNELYCGRHHAELFAPRCPGCDEIIFSNKITKAEGHSWHPEHYCCWNCECLLGGYDFVKTANYSICRECYNQKHAAKCFSCDKLIAPENSIMRQGNKSWHLECFICRTCSISLRSIEFIIHGLNLSCRGCFKDHTTISETDENEKRCDVCLKQVKLTEIHMALQDWVWHEHCFVCVFCKILLMSKPFVRHSAGLVCEGCCEQHIATSCFNCKGKVKDGVIKIGSNSYHKECFRCSKCEISLIDSNFTNVDNSLFCESCNVDLLHSTLLCHVCNNEIIGELFTFKVFNYHPQCFTCTRCVEIIAKKEFFQTKEGIYCKKCAKKLRI